MFTSQTEKLTTVDILLLILAFFVIAGSLGYVLIYKLDSTVDEISVNVFDSNGGYDVSAINSASVDDFMQVSGIGEVKANAIISYRDSLGGFNDVYQLLDLSIIDPQSFEAIISHFYLDDYFVSPDSDEVLSVVDTAEDTSDGSNTEDADSFSLRYVNINTASAAEIAECLQISKIQAEQIVDIREKIGGYNDVWELSLCSLITDEIFSQIRDYLIL